ncbi:MAG: hypothetical protein LAO21_13420 [Acidobacteriia bacterium]|nr:hypothetical protein [Terriglobia bacterium]
MTSGRGFEGKDSFQDNDVDVLKLIRVLAVPGYCFIGEVGHQAKTPILNEGFDELLEHPFEADGMCMEMLRGILRIKTP